MEKARNTSEISVTGRGKKYVVTMDLGATSKELGHELQKLTAVKADTLKLIVQARKSSKLLSPFSNEHSHVTLQQASIIEWKAIQMMGVPKEEIDQVLKNEKSDMRIAGFDEEEKRIRKTVSNGFDTPLQLPQGKYVFGAFKTLDLPGIEVLKKADMIRKNAVESILAERDILISARNPFVVRFFYSFTCRENLYLVMEYLNGGDLFSLLRNLGCLEEDMARVYISELVLALEYLHSLNVVHRELKPDNLLIGPDGHIKQIFANIMNRDIPWPQIPDDMSLEAFDLIDNLLIDNPLQRLGAAGAGEVKRNPFRLNLWVQIQLGESDLRWGIILIGFRFRLKGSDSFRRDYCDLK